MERGSTDAGEGGQGMDRDLDGVQGMLGRPGWVGGVGSDDICDFFIKPLRWGLPLICAVV